MAQIDYIADVSLLFHPLFPRYFNSLEKEYRLIFAPSILNALVQITEREFLIKGLSSVWELRPEVIQLGIEYLRNSGPMLEKDFFPYIFNELERFEKEIGKEKIKLQITSQPEYPEFGKRVLYEQVLTALGFKKPVITAQEPEIAFVKHLKRIGGKSKVIRNPRILIGDKRLAKAMNFSLVYLLYGTEESLRVLGAEAITILLEVS